jgi:hypothetical protein
LRQIRRAAENFRLRLTPLTSNGEGLKRVKPRSQKGFWLKFRGVGGNYDVPFKTGHHPMIGRKYCANPVGGVPSTGWLFSVSQGEFDAIRARLAVTRLCQGGRAHQRLLKTLLPSADFHQGFIAGRGEFSGDHQWAGVLSVLEIG